MVKQSHTNKNTNLLIALDLCQAHYQILLTIFLKYFITINGPIASLALNTYRSKMNY